jgi:rod shape-determining protein MreC
MSDEDVPVGARVLTSGGDQIFPKGLPVGTVAKVMKGKDLFLNIKIKPTADLSKLEEVLVVVEKQEKQATADDKARVRAADILAQRLPSVPDRPTANAASVGIAPEGAAKPAGSANSLPAAKTPAATTSSLAAKSATSSTGTAPAIAPRKTGDQTSTAPLQNQPAGSATTKPSVVPAKPAISQPKPPTPPTTQPGSQPAADDNSPH